MTQTFSALSTTPAYHTFRDKFFFDFIDVICSLVLLVLIPYNSLLITVVMASSRNYF